MIQSLGQIMNSPRPSFDDKKHTFVLDGIKVIMTSKQADRLKQQLRAMKRGVKLSCPRCDAWDIHPLKHLAACEGMKKR